MFKKAIISIVVLFCLWVGGFFWFASNVPSHPSDDLRMTDAIVVLTGGSERLKAGLALLTNGYGSELFISGVGEGATVEELFAGEKEFLPHQLLLLEQRVFLGYSARDTRQNALEVASWVKKREHKSIRLVTSNYHIPRSLKEISRRLPETDIITFPVFPESVKTESWWEYPGTRELLFTEYLKYLAVSFRMLWGT